MLTFKIKPNARLNIDGGKVNFDTQPETDSGLDAAKGIKAIVAPFIKAGEMEKAELPALIESEVTAAESQARRADARHALRAGVEAVRRKDWAAAARASGAARRLM
jgi:hypothetical protein